MDQTKKTLIYVAVAVILAALALVAAPGRITPEAFVEQGALLFPDFTDPNEARTLEVVEFDKESGAAAPFKVTFTNGRWTIPSHHDYPADARERLAQAAAGLIDIHKDEFRTDNVSDHRATGVIDPLDEGASLEGRGKRITIRGQNDKLLADLIIGDPVPGRQGFHFVRLPGTNRVYASQMDLNISTRFQDWIDTDLMRIEKPLIDEVIIRNYSIDERTRAVNQRETLTLSKNDDGRWNLNNLRSGQKLDSLAVSDLLSALDSLSIVGVRPKPAGLSANLRADIDSVEIRQSDIMSLQSKGYYFSRDGQMLSNEGEVEVRTEQGLVYTLRFGEIVYGSGVAVSAGTADADANTGRENRYLFLSTSFDENYFPVPRQPINNEYVNKPESLWTAADFENRERSRQQQEFLSKITRGRQISKELNDRFADWYFVISGDIFDRIRRSRQDLILGQS